MTLLEIARQERQAAADRLAILTSRPLSTEDEIKMARMDLDYWKKSVQFQKKQTSN